MAKKSTNNNLLTKKLQSHRVPALLVMLTASVFGGMYVAYSSAATPQATLKFVSWNVGPDNPRDVGTEIVAFMNTADIMGTQELSVGPEQDSVKAGIVCPTCAYDSTWTDHVYDAALPNKQLILWKKAKYTKLDMGFVDVSPRQTVNDKVGTEIPVKFIAWVKLQDIATGRQFYAINTHLVNGVEAGGKPRTDVSPLRLDNYKHHMDEIVALINTLKASNLPIFMTGDFNANYRYDKTVKNAMFPYVRMGSVGAKSSYQILNLASISSTTPSRLIDYVYAVTRTDVAVTSERFSTSTHGSDHYALYATAVLK